jgi:hypothetical protein
MAWAGWLLATWQIGRGLTRRLALPGSNAWREHLLPVAWIGGMFLWQGLQYVQTMRYLLPIYPMLIMMAAWLSWWLVERAQTAVRAARTTRPAVATAALATTDLAAEPVPLALQTGNGAVQDPRCPRAQLWILGVATSASRLSGHGFSTARRPCAGRQAAWGPASALPSCPAHMVSSPWS